MRDMGFAAWGILLGALRLAFKALAATGWFVAHLAAPVARTLVRMVPDRPKSVHKTESVSVHPVHVLIPATAPTDANDAGPATVFCNDFEVADRIVSMRLDPPVGVINLRVYYDARVVKRDLIISEPRLKSMMRGRRHTFSDADYDPVAGMDGIKDETIALAEKLINDLGNQSVKATKPRKDDFVRANVQPVEQPKPAAKQQQPQQEVTATAPPPPARAEQKSVAMPEKVVAPQVKTGYTYVGQLVQAGSKRCNPPGRAPYEVFEATLALDNGAEMALRGAELERELTANGCQVGQRIAITPMGKVPVTLGNGEEGKKNLYRVQKMGAPSKG